MYAVAGRDTKMRTRGVDRSDAHPAAPSRRRLLAGLGALAATAALAACGAAPPTPAPAAPAPAAPAPATSAQPTGEAPKPAAKAAGSGQPVTIDFWMLGGA